MTEAVAPSFDEAWRVALHEAAHAVAAVVLGIGLVEVWTDGTVGCCTPRGVPSVVGSLCGYVAEWRIDRPGEIPPPEDFHRNRDKSDVRRAIARLGSDNGALLLAVWIEAKKLIDEHWDKVVHTAEALQRRGRLTDAEVEEIWRDASGAA
jgi:hypothetical protein